MTASDIQEPAPWITITGSVQIPNGRYEIEGMEKTQIDSELPLGQIEVYDHPERGQSFWDDGFDDGSDFAGHASTFWLSGLRIRLVIVDTPLLSGPNLPPAKDLTHAKEH